MKALFMFFAFATALMQSPSNSFNQDVLKGYFEKGAPFDFILIDIRATQEMSAVIGNASCKPYNLEWPDTLQQESAKIPKDRTVIVYCAGGNRSRRAAEYLRANGFTNVLDGGGFRNWTGPTLPLSEIKATSLLPEPSMKKK
jgi:rhodanese-related sulfurtransferase